jgi:3-oxoacyl-[acyl-carrier-protein] synthase II
MRDERSRVTTIGEPEFLRWLSLPEIDPARRAVITGLGAIMPIGNDFPTYWSNLVAGVTGTRLIQGFETTGFEVRIAAEVLGFDPAAAMDPKMARRMTRFIHFAMAAGKEAIADSGIDFAAMTEDERDRVGVVVNTGGGGIEAIIDGTHVHDTKGPRFVSPFAVPALSGSMGAALLSIEYGLTGPVMTQVAACATSVIAFHDALRLIRSGECDVVLTGGSEAPIVPMGVAALANMTALSKRNDSPETASRPFDKTRDGFVLGEGGGVVVVESLAHALERGATPIAEVIGGALTADAFHISAPEPSGRGQARAMTLALKSAGVAPNEIDYIVAHGTATPLNDQTETRAIKTAYGDFARRVAISSPKSMIGHLVGAAGIASVLAGVGAIRDQIIPPTANLHTPDPECDLDYVPLTARKAKVETVAVHGFGFGGQNAVAILRRVEA